MTDYRHAVLDELPELVALARAATRDAYPYLPFDPVVTEEVFEDVILKDEAMVWVAEDHSGLVGFVAGEINLSWFGDGRVASDWITYASPDAGPWVGYRLHKHFVDWARSQGADSIVATNFSNLPNDGMDRVFKRLGYEVVGSTVRLNPAQAIGE